MGEGGGAAAAAAAHKRFAPAGAASCAAPACIRRINSRQSALRVAREMVMRAILDAAEGPPEEALEAIDWLRENGDWVKYLKAPVPLPVLNRWMDAQQGQCNTTMAVFTGYRMYKYDLMAIFSDAQRGRRKCPNSTKQL